MKIIMTETIEHWVICDECAVYQSLYSIKKDRKKAEEVFSSKGWKLLKGKTLCPYCAKAKEHEE